MGLIDLFKPRWKNSNWEIRLDAVKDIDDESVLMEIVLSDKNKEVELAAAKRITSHDSLLRLAQNDSPSIRLIAINIIQDDALLAKIAESDRGSSIDQLAVSKIKNKDILKRLATECSKVIVKLCALENLGDASVLNDYIRDNIRLVCAFVARQITVDLRDHMNLHREDNTQNLLIGFRKHSDSDLKLKVIKLIVEYNIELSETVKSPYQKLLPAYPKNIIRILLEEFSKNDLDENIRARAIELIDNQELLEHIVKNDPDQSPRRAAAKGIRNQILLSQVATTDSDYHVMKAAVQGIKDQSLLVNIIKANLPAQEVIESVNHLMSTDQIGKLDPFYEARCAALDQLNDNSILVDLAMNAVLGYIRIKAVQRLEKWVEMSVNPSLLDIAKSGSHVDAKIEAIIIKLGLRHIDESWLSSIFTTNSRDLTRPIFKECFRLLLCYSGFRDNERCNHLTFVLENILENVPNIVDDEELNRIIELKNYTHSHDFGQDHIGNLGMDYRTVTDVSFERLRTLAKIELGNRQSK